MNIYICKSICNYMRHRPSLFRSGFSMLAFRSQIPLVRSQEKDPHLQQALSNWGHLLEGLVFSMDPKK